MKKGNKQYNLPQRFQRSFKLNFIKLFRSPGGARKVSLGFAIGFGLEMLVISSAALVYVIFYPIVKMAKASLPAAIIGNVIGKLTFLPVLLLPFAKRLGSIVYPNVTSDGTVQEHSFIDIIKGDVSIINILHGGIHIIIGMSIFGLILGVISYYVIWYFYKREVQRRVTRRAKIETNSPRFLTGNKRDKLIEMDSNNDIKKRMK